LKGLLKGFKLALRLWESSKIWWRYDQMKFVTKKVFTKIDLRWGFNNVRIKEGDEWKEAFTMHIGFFEPTVMFFGIMNSLVTF